MSRVPRGANWVGRDASGLAWHAAGTGEWDKGKAMWELIGEECGVGECDGRVGSLETLWLSPRREPACERDLSWLPGSQGGAAPYVPTPGNRRLESDLPHEFAEPLAPISIGARLETWDPPAGPSWSPTARSSSAGPDAQESGARTVLVPSLSREVAHNVGAPSRQPRVTPETISHAAPLNAALSTHPSTPPALTSEPLASEPLASESLTSDRLASDPSDGDVSRGDELQSRPGSAPLCVVGPGIVVGELAFPPTQPEAAPVGGAEVELRGDDLGTATTLAAPSVKRRLRRKASERPSVRDRPCCPVHAVPMLVGRTVGRVQYRYCQVPGCRESCTTLRALHPHKGRLPEPVRRVG